MLPPAGLWAISDVPIRVLAVIGAFAMGFVVVGWAVYLIVKFTTTKNTPLWLLTILRCLGGLLTGWLAALWLFGGGGGGLGGPGGTGLAGPGKGGSPETSIKKNQDKEKEKTGKTEQPGIGEGTSIQVEVLGPDPLRKLAGKDSADPLRVYRVVGPENKLLTLDELQVLLRARRENRPPLVRLEIVLYQDSPDKEVSHVASLARWARDLGNDRDRFRVDYSFPDRYAPVQ